MVKHLMNDAANTKAASCEELPLNSLFDAHAHLSFAPSDQTSEFADWVSGRFAGAFSTTVSPQDFRAAFDACNGLPNVKVGVGAHPWWVAQGKINAEELNAALPLFSEAQYVGEVGLDFGKNGLTNSAFATEDETKRSQLEALRSIFAACQAAPQERVFSFHVVQSADIVLDMLEEFSLLAGNTCIFHWFSGSGTQLQRAREAGCCFSVNAFMLNTKRGREYARAIPLDRLFSETDLPSELAAVEGLEQTQATYEQALLSAYFQIAELRGVQAIDQISKNVQRVFN